MLKQRMQTLRDAGVISGEIADFMDQVIDLLAERFPSAQQEKLEMFTTHLAMAAERIRKGETVDELDEGTWEEIRGSEHFAKAKDFMDEMLAICPVDFPEGESRFMMLHICSMLSD